MFFFLMFLCALQFVFITAQLKWASIQSNPLIDAIAEVLNNIRYYYIFNKIIEENAETEQQQKNGSNNNVCTG